MRTTLLTLLFASLFFAPLFAQPQQTPRSGEPVEGVVLVKFAPEGLPDLKQQIRPNDLPEAASRPMGNQPPLRKMLPFEEGRKVFSNFTPADTLDRHRDTGEEVRLLDLSRWYTLTVPDTSRIEALVERLEKHPMVEAAAPQVPFQASVVTPDDDEFQNGDQWNLDNPTYDADIDAPEAWELNKGRSDVTLAIIDSGVDYNHSDLDPGNRSRVISGRDVADDDGDPFPNYSGNDLPFDPSHGTYVAGVAGAITDNNQDIAGVMWNTQIMPVKIAYTDGPWFDFVDFSEGTSFPTVMGEGVEYARNNGADIINLSFGRPSPWTLERLFIGNPLGEAVYNAYLQGLVVVAASGNDDEDQVDFPASSAGVFSVGNTTITDVRNDDEDNGSNYGPNLDIVAPGTAYPSTEKGGGVKQFLSGTSLSAPMVAGVAGLILSESRDRNLDLTNDDIQHLMEQTADDLGPSGRDDEYGHGRVNARKALEALQPPNDAVQASHTGGSGQKIFDDVKQVFYDNGQSSGIATGTYFVNVHEVTGHVDFSTYFQDEPPMVWIRERSTKGWSAANPNSEMPWVKITNVTQSGFDFKTYAYYVDSDIYGREIDSWYPASPSNVKIAYTAVGEPGPAPLNVFLSGPGTLNSGEQGTWTASVSGGEGSTSYDWDYRPAGSYSWYDKNCSGSTCSHTYYGDGEQGGIRVSVTKGSESDQATASVYVIQSCGSRICLKSKTKTVAVEGPEVKTQTNRTADLQWAATGPLPSGVFEVQHRADSTAAWSKIGTVSTADSVQSDTTGGPTYRFATDQLPIGAHQFRLKLSTSEASRSDASEWTSEPAVARIELNSTYRLSTYPNPVRQQATVELAVKERQQVQTALYDVLGRRITTLHEGPVRRQETKRWSLDAAGLGLSNGTYFVQVTGEDFSATRRLTVVR